MNSPGWAAWLAALLFIGMLVCLEAGFRFARSRRSDSGQENVGAIEAAVFGLFGLLLAFSFSGGMSRLDARREMIVHEANAIGTAYLRLDLVPAAEQPEMRRLFREYVDQRLAIYRNLLDADVVKRGLNDAGVLQQKIWSRALSVSRADPNTSTALLLLPAVNEMIDVTTSRTVALHTRQPMLISALLIGVALLSGLLAGYTMAKVVHRSWLHMIVYSLVASMTIYAVADLDNPRSGLIRVDAADAALIELRQSMR